MPRRRIDSSASGLQSEKDELEDANDAAAGIAGAGASLDIRC